MFHPRVIAGAEAKLLETWSGSLRDGRFHRYPVDQVRAYQQQLATGG